MRKNYDFSKAKKNPYFKRLTQQITIRLNKETVHYFKVIAAESGIPYQTLINLYLKECVEEGRKPSMRKRGKIA